MKADKRRLIVRAIAWAIAWSAVMLAITGQTVYVATSPAVATGYIAVDSLLRWLRRIADGAGR